MRKIFLAIVFCLLFYAFAFSQEAIHIDEFRELSCDDYLARMDATLTQANNNPTAKVYVFVYEGKTQKYIYGKNETKSVFLSPQYGLAETKIGSMKKYVAIRSSSLKSFIFIKAGFRENFTVDIWLVPAGVNPPELAPTLTKVKYRKGKPTEFCTGCC